MWMQVGNDVRQTVTEWISFFLQNDMLQFLEGMTKAAKEFLDSIPGEQETSKYEPSAGQKANLVISLVLLRI